MPRYKCPKGTRKCITGKCVKKTSIKTVRCKKGTRKCANNRCYPTNYKKSEAAKKIQKTYRNYIDSKLKKKPLKEQVEHFNKIQDKFIFKLNGKKIIIITNDIQSNYCAIINIESPTHIYLDMLYKCGESSGTQVIKLIEKFAKKYGYKKIELEDDSRIYSEKTKFRPKKGGYCMIWLPILQILSSGTTWYNKLGYKSPYYNKEVKHNEAIIKIPFIKFMKSVVGNIRDEDPRASSFESLIEGMYLFVNKDESSISVKDLFTKVNRKLRNEELICGDGKHPELDWYLDIEKFLVDRGAVVNNISKVNPNNIMYLRNSGMFKTTQIKHIE
jgi:hypothetical protein